MRRATFDAHVKDVEDAKRAKYDERIAAEAAALKDGLRTRFLLNPGASEADFEKAYPRLLEDHRIQ